MEKPIILVVDDDPASVKSLVKYLHLSGFKTMVAPNGERALRQLELTQPDMILLDILMPGIDGFETCRRLKKNEAIKDIPVIFMTALTETVDKVKGFEAGGVDYLTKPAEHEEILARIKTHLTIRQLQRQLQQEHDRFQSLAEATLEGIVIYDGERILEVNHVVVGMFGYSRSELLGENILELLTPESRDMISEYLRAGDQPPYEAEGITKDGESIPVEIQVRALSWQGHAVKVAAIRDIMWRREMAQLKEENVTLRSTLKDRYKFGEIIGKSPVMQEVYESIAKASASDVNVVICGESGTGKELAAHMIHQKSKRSKRTLVAVNCGAIPETLFEREFFGHRKGAFTGADRDRPGYFDRAHGGTLFLDEVGELKPALQVKLLRVLQDKEYIPLGDTISKKVDVRIIAATNKDLRKQLEKGLIREDFFYRIRVFVINLPLLRDRKEDIPLLIEHFLDQYTGGKGHPAIPTRILEALRTYHWPGNVRELQNELQRYLAEQRLEFLRNDPVKLADMPDSDVDPEGQGLYEAVEALEKRMIINALSQSFGRREKTADMLKIQPRTLYRKIKKYGLL